MSRVGPPCRTLTLLWLLAAARLPALGQEDQAVLVQMTGRVTTGILAIGGETTGTTISAGGSTWELDLSRVRESVPSPDDLHGRTVRVHGQLDLVEGVERGPRWIVRVDRLEPVGGEEGQGGARSVTLTGRREDTRARVHRVETTVVEIFSPFGIDRAEVRRSGSQWPEPLVVRLHLRGLEGFRARSGKWLLERSADDPARLALRKVQTAPESATDAGPIGRHSGEAGAGYFEIPLPGALFEGNPPAITLEWVDFYR